MCSAKSWYLGRFEGGASSSVKVTATFKNVYVLFQMPDNTKATCNGAFCAKSGQLCTRHQPHAEHPGFLPFQ